MARHLFEDLPDLRVGLRHALLAGDDDLLEQVEHVAVQRTGDLEQLGAEVGQREQWHTRLSEFAHDGDAARDRVGDGEVEVVDVGLRRGRVVRVSLVDLGDDLAPRAPAVSGEVVCEEVEFGVGEQRCRRVLADGVEQCRARLPAHEHVADVEHDHVDRARLRRVTQVGEAREVAGVGAVEVVVGLPRSLSGEEGAADAHATHQEIRDVAFSFEGPFGKYDQFQLQRGLQVYTEVCSACHSLHQVSFRDL